MPSPPIRIAEQWDYVDSLTMLRQLGKFDGVPLEPYFPGYDPESIKEKYESGEMPHFQRHLGLGARLLDVEEPLEQRIEQHLRECVNEIWNYGEHGNTETLSKCIAPGYQA